MVEIEIVAPGDSGVLYNKFWPIQSAGRCLPQMHTEAGDHIGKIVLKVAE